MDYENNTLAIEVVVEKKGKEKVVGRTDIDCNTLSKEGLPHEQHLELEAPDTTCGGYIHCVATYRAKMVRESTLNIDHALSSNGSFSGVGNMLADGVLEI